MISTNLIIGVAIIVINLIPLLLKKYKYLIITLILSLILAIINNLGIFQ